MPWFVDEIIKSVKKIPSVVDNILNNEVVYMKPQPVDVASSTPPTKKLESPFTGTNYDPYDPQQNDPTRDPALVGVGAGGFKIDENMVATTLQKDLETATLRLGTVIRVPELDRVFLVGDLLNKRFAGQNKIDFATPQKGSVPDPTFNKDFKDIEILREGQGYADARQFVESGEWQKMLDAHNQSKGRNSPPSK